jgi:hypothetical protein
MRFLAKTVKLKSAAGINQASEVYFIIKITPCLNKSQVAFSLYEVY